MKKEDNDPQQADVYRWEDSFVGWPGAHLSKKHARNLLKLACNKYRIPVPSIIFPKRDRGAKGRILPSEYLPAWHRISIRPRHMNAAIVLHEAAHAITDYILGSDLQSHGPEWLGVYMVLLEDFYILPREALEVLANKAKLKYRSRAFVAPGIIRKKYKKRHKAAKKDWRYWFSS